MDLITKGLRISNNLAKWTMTEFKGLEFVSMEQDDLIQIQYIELF